MRSIGGLAVILALSGAAVLSSQDISPPNPRLVFDAASVRESRAPDPEGSLGERPGGYAATNVPLRLLIVRAYRLRSFQVVGGPAWVDAARFDLVARAPSAAAPADVFPMLQNLLRERFALTLRAETREQPVYALVRARPDGRLGPQLQPSVATCADAAAGATGNPCTMGGSFVGRGGTLKGVGQPLTQLVASLGTAVDRLVVDRTGLSGLFDVDLRWSSGGFRAGGGNTVAGDDGPSVFTAVQEQLHLKLDPARGPVDILVIESAQRPTPD